MSTFKLRSPFKPAGDQPAAIEEIVGGISGGSKDQILLGVTGSGKTFSIASAISKLDRPALILSPNKVLAAQLYAEFKSFFPQNAVEYFISYYDYYQPEAYVPQTDTYIEKDASINEQIDRLRLKATMSLLSRKDVVVVASVSAIYNIGDPKNFARFSIRLKKGQTVSRTELLDKLVSLHYTRNETEFSRGTFRAKGGTVDIFPAYAEVGLRVETLGDAIARISEFHPLTGDRIRTLEEGWVYPSKHFITSEPEVERALVTIREELAARLKELRALGKDLEAQRLEQRTKYDMEMLQQLGYCPGIENYSRHLAGSAPGARPYCLLDYLPEDALIVLDESHVGIPQIGGMYEGDRARKQTLVDFGFRLPSALDNRPLKFREFESLAKTRVYVSATPGPYELKRTRGEFIEQVVRPTGLVDPEVEIHPTEGQIDHLIEAVRKTVKAKERALVTTLTKRTAEDLAEHLSGKGLRVRYLHSDIDSLTRVDILQDLRLGKFDVLVGINLLREGLDLPEVSLVAILGADNEGFLRSETTLIQIAGRAARNVNGRVILYANKKTKAMTGALGEMSRRREKQLAHNAKHKIQPKTVKKAVTELLEFQREAKQEGLSLLRKGADGPIDPKNLPKVLERLEAEMNEAAENLDFETAAALRDQLFELKGMSVRGGADNKQRPPKKRRPPKKKYKRIKR